MIKVIKRKTIAHIPSDHSEERPQAPPTTVTTTVNDWIAESRKNRIEQENSSRETIAGWTAAAHT